MKRTQAEQEMLKYAHLKNKELVHSTYKIKMKVNEMGIAETSKGSRNFYVFFELSGKLGHVTETLDYILLNYSLVSKQILNIKDEGVLVDAILEGHKKGLCALYDHYAHALFGVIQEITKDRHTSEKLTQQTFCYVWQNIQAYYVSNKSFFCWLVSIARKLASDVPGHKPDHTRHARAILADRSMEEKRLLELVVIKGLTVPEILKELATSKEELIRELKLEIDYLKKMKPDQECKDYLRPGLLELYCLGLTSPDENDSITDNLQNMPEIYSEIEKIIAAVMSYFEGMAGPLNITLKSTILAIVDYVERMKAGEKISFPPVLNKNSKISDYLPLLDNKEMAAPEDFTDMFVKIISSQIFVTTAIVWVKDKVPYETHDYEFEKFLILEGSCDIILQEDVVSLGRGDYFAIPLHTGHLIKVTSKTPCKLILQKIAA
jgi:mannose-6-phosphate isomerase-like protein (cupin superfamily)